MYKSDNNDQWLWTHQESESRDVRQGLVRSSTGCRVDRRIGVAFMEEEGEVNGTFHTSLTCRYARPLNYYVDAGQEMGRARPDAGPTRRTIV